MDNLRIYVATWNVGTSSPNIDINALLDFPSITDKRKALPDLYVLGFQEVKSQPQNILLDAVFDDPWTKAVTDVLKKENFIRVKTERLQGLLLMVFCLRSHVMHLRDNESQYTRTGLGGYWGNKGAVSIRFSLYGCSLCFVNAHLTAHDNMLEERVNDYNRIVNTHSYNAKETSNIFYHDYVFWFGDLNFRLKEDAFKTPNEVAEYVRRAEKDNYYDLLEEDQLKFVMNNRSAFYELKESNIAFPPTYKFVVGTNEYDLKRRPAWCDRILYSVSTNNYDNVKLCATQLSYNSLPQYVNSDHKPVVSEFNIKIAMKKSSFVVPPLRKIMTYSGTESDSIQDDEDVFSNYTERCVEFLPIKEPWYFGDNSPIIKFTLSNDIKINDGDWIGVFESDFDNLDEYITYEYVSKANTIVPEGSDSTRMVVFSFPLGSGIRSPGFYKYLYFSQPMSEVKSVLGISEQFEVRARDDQVSEAASSFDPQTPSTSSSSSQPSTSGNQGMINSLIQGVSQLHVPGMRFDKLNDLGID